MNIIILQWRPEDRDALKASIEKNCPQLLPHTVIEGDFDDNIRDIIKCTNEEDRIQAQKRIIVVTGHLLLTISGVSILKRIKKWNKHAKIILFSAMNELRNDKRVYLFREKKRSKPETFDEIISVLNKHNNLE